MKTVNFTIQGSYQLNNGTREVKIMFHIDRSTVRLGTHVHVLPQNWDAAKQQVKKTDPDFKDKQLLIESCRSKIFEIQKKYRLEWKTLTLEKLKSEYRIFSTKIDFYEFMQHEINSERISVEKVTALRREGILRKLKAFKKSLSFSEIDEQFLKAFDAFMRDKLKNKKSTRFKSLSILRHYVNIAVKAKYLEQDPFQYMKIRDEKTDIIYLERNELESLKTLYMANQLPANRQKALRIFLFCCYTGLRISDVEGLRWTHILDNHIYKVAHKTRNQKSRALDIPISNFANRLIEDENFKSTNGKVFRPIHRYTVSKHVKYLADSLGIKKEISTKTGRHTFATLFLENGGALEVLQLLLGHSNIRETMIYVHVSKERIRQQMALFDTYLE